MLGEVALEVAHLARALIQAQRAIADDADAGRVIAAIFESVQAFDQDWRGVLTPDITHDPTHQALLSVDQSSDLPLGVRGRTEASRRQLSGQSPVDLGIRRAIGLQRAVPTAHE